MMGSVVPTIRLYNEVVGDYSMPFVVARKRFERWLLLPSSLLLFGLNFVFRNGFLAIPSLLLWFFAAATVIALYPDVPYRKLMFGQRGESSVCSGPLSHDERWIIGKAALIWSVGMGCFVLYVVPNDQRWLMSGFASAVSLAMVVLVCAVSRRQRPELRQSLKDR